ncbi:MAG: methyltransferase domain-containing protein [Magnetococcus sp. DMHC-6]
MFSHQVLHRSQWHHEIIEVVEKDGVRYLHFGNHMRQSAMSLEDPHHLVLPYTRHMMACLMFIPSPKRILMLGLGGGSMAKFLHHHFPQSSVDVVDINARVIAVAHQFFYMPKDERIRIHLIDGEQFIDQAQTGQKNVFDLILIDLFNAKGQVSSIHNAEFYQKCHQLLSPVGLIAINMSRANGSNYQHISTTIQENGMTTPLHLPVGETLNEIIFSPTLQTTPLVWKNLQPKASALEKQLNLEYSHFLQRMVKVNTPLWRRLFEKGGI